MRECGSILESLQKNRVYKSVVNESDFDYIATLKGKRQRLETAINEFLNKKYGDAVSSLFCEDLGCDIAVSDERDLLVDDVIQEIVIYIIPTKGVNLKSIQKSLSKIFNKYPDVELDMRNKEFYIAAESYDDVVNLLDVLEKDGCKLNGVYTIVSYDDVQNRLEVQMKEWEDEKDALGREYDRSRL